MGELENLKEKIMKRILIVFLALILVACGTPAPVVQPTAAPPEPTQTAVVLVETVVVTVIPTNLPTDVPAATLPPPTEVPATQPPAEATQPAAPTEAVPAADAGLLTVDDKLGAGWFVSMTRDRSDFSLRCNLNKQITFKTKATDAFITQVDFWYRFEDRSNGAVFEWVNAGKMIPDNEGNFTITLSGDQVSPNFRKPNSWFDFQFIGYNSTGVVGRSEKIERQVTYTFDCP